MPDEFSDVWLLLSAAPVCLHCLSVSVSRVPVVQRNEASCQPEATRQKSLQTTSRHMSLTPSAIFSLHYSLFLSPSPSLSCFYFIFLSKKKKFYFTSWLTNKSSLFSKVFLKKEQITFPRFCQNTRFCLALI